MICRMSVEGARKARLVAVAVHLPGLDAGGRWRADQRASCASRMAGDLASSDRRSDDWGTNEEGMEDQFGACRTEE